MMKRKALKGDPMNKALLAAILLGFSITASGQQLMGFGVYDCGQMLAHDRTRPDLKYSYIHWIQGYLSALNQEGYLNKTQVMADLSPDAIYFSVLNVCRENPTYPVWEAAMRWRLTQ